MVGPLLAALKDDETGGLYVFTDEGQRVFNRHGSPPVPLVPLVLDHNLRAAGSSGLTSADSGHTDRRILVLTSANVG